MGAIISVLKNIISTKRKDYFDHMYTDDIYEDFDKEYIVLGVDMDGPTELEVNSHRDLQYNEDEEDPIWEEETNLEREWDSNRSVPDEMIEMEIIPS